MIYKKLPSFSYRCYRKDFESIHDVIHQMKTIETELANTDMKNLIAFNRTYLIITEAVTKKLGSGYFKDDRLMERFDIKFARYYFDALKDYSENTNCPPAWKLLFDLCKKDNTYQFIYMALGVNAHVNNDLGQSLYDIADYGYKIDFDKVNDVINTQIPLVISSLHEDSQIVEKSKNILRPLYSFILHLIIKNWRKNAWQTFILMRSNTKTIQDIESEALRIGNHFAKFRKLI